MNTAKLKRYRFSNSAQWGKCLFVGEDRILRGPCEAISLVKPFAQAARPYPPKGASAPVITHTGEILWRNNEGTIHRLGRGDDEPRACPAPHALGCAKRIVASSSGLWAMSDPREPLQPLQRFEEETLTRLLTVDVPHAPVLDIADAGRGNVWAVVQDDGASQALCIDRFGRVVETVSFRGISKFEAFVFLRRRHRFVVLAGESHQRLCWYSVQGGSPLYSLAVAGMRPCFRAAALGSDSMDKVFIAGADGERFGGQPHVIIHDGDGNRLGELPLDREDDPVTGITARRDQLVVTGPRGLVKYVAGNVVPASAGLLECRVVTPVLFSADRADRRRWLRVEATARLPEGCTLEILWAATNNKATRDRLNDMATDAAVPAGRRVANLLDDPDLRQDRTLFHGAADGGERPEKTFSAKLFGVDERFLWVAVKMSAAPGARLPTLKKLEVLYPGRTLMEDLPAIYQAEEDREGSFLRSLVGVLETTTQGLDARIGSLGRNVHPETANEEWLNYLARWLGIPWDDALSFDQKRKLIKRAPELAKGRGTRAGLEAVLESLIPGKSRRFRVIDATADFGFAIVGGEWCAGSSLPALLGGRAQWQAELDSTAVLRQARLAGARHPDDGVWEHVGKISIDVAATAEERVNWEPWLLPVINQIVPLHTKVELRWVAQDALRTRHVDGTLLLESNPEPHLGTDAILGWARLPESETRLTAGAPNVGERLY